MDITQIITYAGAALGALHLLAVGAIAVSTLIPGDQPEKTLIKVDEVLQRFISWITPISKK